MTDTQAEKLIYAVQSTNQLLDAMAKQQQEMNRIMAAILNIMRQR